MLTCASLVEKYGDCKFSVDNRGKNLEGGVVFCYARITQNKNNAISPKEGELFDDKITVT